MSADGGLQEDWGVKAGRMTVERDVAVALCIDRLVGKRHIVGELRTLRYLPLERRLQHLLDDLFVEGHPIPRDLGRRSEARNLLARLVIGRYARLDARGHQD